MRNKCHIFLIYPRQNKGGNLFETLVVTYSYMSHIKQKAKEKKMSTQTIEIKQEEGLYVILPNGDKITIFTYGDDLDNDVNIHITRHNGDWTNYPVIDYKEKAQLGNVERYTTTINTNKKGEKCKINEKTLTLTGLSESKTAVTVKTFNTQSN